MPLGDPFDNTPPVAKALAGSAFDNTAPASRAVTLGAFDNAAPAVTALAGGAFTGDSPEGAPVRAAATFIARVVITADTGVTVWPGDFYDDVQVVSGDTVLLVGEAGPENNGLYLVQASLVRVPGADTAASLNAGLRVHVQQGTVGAGKVYLLTTPPPIVLGDSSLLFSEITAYPRAL
jgi:hypothetical protein